MSDRARRYARKACEACRKRKDRCDATSPTCGNCEKRGIDCVNGDPSRKRGLPPGYTKTLERRVRRLEHFIKISTASSPIPRNQFDTILADMRESEASQDFDRYINSLVTTTETSLGTESWHYNESRSPYPPSSAIDSRTLDENLVEPTGLLSVNENSVISHVGATSGIHLVTECEEIDREVWLVDSPMHTRNPHTQKWAAERDVNDFIALLPPPEAQQEVFDRFFADTSPYLMFLSRDLVEDISTCLMEPGPTDLSDLCLPHASTNHRKKERAALLLFTVLATGASHLEQPIKGLDRPERYKLLAMELLAQLGDHLTLECVQSLLLMTWKEEGCDHSAQAWLHLGHAIRVAFHLGLNRSCESWTFLDDSERRVRDQCWWGCFIADSVVSLRLGRSPTIHEEDVDVDIPFRSVAENMGERVRVEVIRLAFLINRINRTLYGVNRKSINFNHERDELNKELVEWHTRLPDDMQVPLPNSICPHHAVLTMHLLFHTTLLILHRPFVSRTYAASYEIYRTSALASSLILGSYRYTHNGLRSNPFIIFHTFTSAVALMYFAQSTEKSLSEPAKFGFEECLVAFRAIEGTWAAARTALNLIAHAFHLGNVIIHNRHYSIMTDSEAIQQSEYVHDRHEDIEGGALNDGPNDGNLWCDYEIRNTISLREIENQMTLFRKHCMTR